MTASGFVCEALAGGETVAAGVAAIVEIVRIPHVDVPGFEAGTYAEIVGASTSALGCVGLTLEPVDRPDNGDNPILGHHASAQRADDIAPKSSRVAPDAIPGAIVSFQVLTAFDEAHALEGQTRLAGVYDYMLRDDATASGGTKDNGLIDVSNGRHRFEQAKLNGVKFVPVRTTQVTIGAHSEEDDAA
jgi:hypothetical protein